MSAVKSMEYKMRPRPSQTPRGVKNLEIHDFIEKGGYLNLF